MTMHVRQFGLSPARLLKSACVSIVILGVAIAAAVAVPTAAAANTTSTFDCSSDVLFIGARGSGQDYDPETLGMGPQVHSAFLQLQSRLNSARIPRTVTAVSVDYPAEDVLFLLTDASRYFMGLEVGHGKVLEILTEWALRPECQHQNIVLAGYSQGAMVMHRVLWSLAAGDWNDIPDRINGVILIADGDRAPNDGMTYLGTERDKRTRGIGGDFPAISGTRNQTLPPPWDGKRVYSICNKHDLVCGLRFIAPAVLALPPYNGGDVHKGYIDDPAVNKAVRSIRFSFVPRFSNFNPLVSGVAGQAFTHSFPAAIENSCSLSWSKRGRWPEWAHLDEATGQVSGSSPTAWTSTASVEVTSHCPHLKSQRTRSHIRFEMRPTTTSPVEIGQFAPWLGYGRIAVDAKERAVVARVTNKRDVVVSAPGDRRVSTLRFRNLPNHVQDVATSVLGGTVVIGQDIVVQGMEVHQTGKALFQPFNSRSAVELPLDPAFQPIQAGVDDLGRVYIFGLPSPAASPTILRLQPDASSFEDLSHVLASAPRAMSVQPNGNLFYTTAHSAYKLPANSTASELLAAAPTSGLGNLVATRSGDLFYNGGNGIYFIPNGANAATRLDLADLSGVHSFDVTDRGDIFVVRVSGQTDVVKYPRSAYQP